LPGAGLRVGRRRHRFLERAPSLIRDKSQLRLDTPSELRCAVTDPSPSATLMRDLQVLLLLGRFDPAATECQCQHD